MKATWIFVAFFMTLTTPAWAKWDYYTQLEKKCQKLGTEDKECCISSVQSMRETRSKLAKGKEIAQAKCPKGTTPNMLRCAASLKWCEPAQKAPPATQHP